MGVKEDRVCVTCKHWNLDLGSHWSEATPGDSASLSCDKGHYSFNMGDGGRDAYVKAIESAKTCPDYERRMLA